MEITTNNTHVQYSHDADSVQDYQTQSLAQMNPRLQDVFDDGVNSAMLDLHDLDGEKIKCK